MPAVTDPAHWAAVIVARSRNSHLSDLAGVLATAAVPPAFEIELDARTVRLLTAQLNLREQALRRLVDALAANGYLTIAAPPVPSGFGRYRLAVPGTDPRERPTPGCDGEIRVSTDAQGRDGYGAPRPD